MRIKDVMTPGVEAVTAEVSITMAAARMRDDNIGSLPVIDRDRLVGMITDRDICCRVVAEGRDPDTTRVKDVMSTDVLFCFEDQDITAAAGLMEMHRVRRIVILNRDKTLSGFLSVEDLARWNHRLAGEVLEAVRPSH